MGDRFFYNIFDHTTCGTKSVKAYLAGAIEHAPDNGKRWRRQVTEFLAENLGHQVYDPTVEEFQILTPAESKDFRSLKKKDLSAFRSIVGKLIDHDLKTLVSSVDYVICYWDQHVLNGGGTHGEVTLSYHYDIPVYLVAGMPREDISGWILGCSSELFGDFRELEQFLIEKFTKAD